MWINFGIATTFRIIIIGIRVVFEYVVQRIALSTIYLFLASLSFLYSAHVMPQFYFSLLAVAAVDLGLVISLVTFIFMIKCLSRKQNMTLKCRQVFHVIALVLFIGYIAFVTAIAIMNYVQRTQSDVDYSQSLFYSECFFVILYLLFFGISKMRERGHFKSCG